MANPPLIAYSELATVAQTAYAQLLEAALGVEHSRTVADLPGSFVTKLVKGRQYWYYQYTEPSGRLRQLYVGPDSEAVRQLMEHKSKKPVTDGLLPMVRSALALGCAGLLPRHYQVIRRLADYGREGFRHRCRTDPGRAPAWPGLAANAGQQAHPRKRRDVGVRVRGGNQR